MGPYHECHEWEHSASGIEEQIFFILSVFVVIFVC